MEGPQFGPPQVMPGRRCVRGPHQHPAAAAILRRPTSASSTSDKLRQLRSELRARHTSNSTPRLLERPAAIAAVPAAHTERDSVQYQLGRSRAGITKSIQAYRIPCHAATVSRRPTASPTEACLRESRYATTSCTVWPASYVGTSNAKLPFTTTDSRQRYAARTSTCRSQGSK